MDKSSWLPSCSRFSILGMIAGFRTITTKIGYSPIGFVRCGRSACRISALKWKMGKETGANVKILSFK